jgi:GNAT superfamily N-acetyltransferase
VSPPFRIEPLGSHERGAFSCGREPLDRYFKTQVSQDIRRLVANCFVAVEASTGTVAGYYTLAAASIGISDLPSAMVKRLPRYPTVPAVRIGRLAIGEQFQGRGLGAALLADAAARVIAADVAAFALLVDAKDDEAVSFYAHHGFEPFECEPRTLFLPLVTAARAWQEGRRRDRRRV